MYEKLKEKESKIIREEGKCPECNGDLETGARGGMSINVRCIKCKQVYNVPPYPFSVEKIKH